MVTSATEGFPPSLPVQSEEQTRPSKRQKVTDVSRTRLVQSSPYIPFVPMSDPSFGSLERVSSQSATVTSAETESSSSSKRKDSSSVKKTKKLAKSFISSARSGQVDSSAQIKGTEDLDGKVDFYFSLHFYKIVTFLHQVDLENAEKSLHAHQDYPEMQFLNVLLVCLRNQQKQQVDNKELKNAKKVLKKAFEKMNSSSYANSDPRFMEQMELTLHYINAYRVGLSSISLNFMNIVDNLMNIIKDSSFCFSSKKYENEYLKVVTSLTYKKYQRALVQVDTCIKLFNSPLSNTGKEKYSVFFLRSYLIKAGILFKLSRLENSEEYLRQARDTCLLIETCAELVDLKKTEEDDMEYLLDLAKKPLTEKVEVDLSERFYRGA